MTDKKMKIEFAPGCFDNIEFENQEELDALMAQIQDMFDSGEAQVMAVPLDELLDDLTDEELQQLMDEVSDEVGVEELSPSFTTKRTLH